MGTTREQPLHAGCGKTDRLLVRHFSNVNGFGSEILCCNLHPPSTAQVLPYVPKPWGIQCILAQLSLGSHQICRFQHVSISSTFRIINLMICFCQSSLLSTHFLSSQIQGQHLPFCIVPWPLVVTAGGQPPFFSCEATAYTVLGQGT